MVYTYLHLVDYEKNKIKVNIPYMDELYKIVHKTLVLRRFSILLKNHGDSDLYGPSWWLNQAI